MGELRELAEVLLSLEDFPQIIERIPQTDRDNLIQKLHQVYQQVDAEQKRFLELYGRFCSLIKALPVSASLTTGLTTSDAVAVISEGIADIWRGRYGGAHISIRAFHASRAQADGVKEVLFPRIPMWKKLDHPNISTFHGMAAELFPLGLVYDWEGNRNVLQYLESNPGSSRLRLLLEVAMGLQYLHLYDIAHGNLRGKTVLVNESGQVRLTGYGLAPLYADQELTSSLQSSGIERWLAPELISESANVTESKRADIFALGMLGIELFTGRPPFEDCSEFAAPRLILNGRRPEFPQNAEALGLTGEVRQLLQKCWDQDPAQRLTIEEVVRSIQDLLRVDHTPQVPPPPGGNGRQSTRLCSWIPKWLGKLICGSG